MKSSWPGTTSFSSETALWPSERLLCKSLGGFWVRSPSGPSTSATSEPTTSPQIRSARRSDPTGHHERGIRIEGRKDRYDSNRQSTRLSKAWIRSIQLSIALSSTSIQERRAFFGCDMNTFPAKNLLKFREGRPPCRPIFSPYVMGPND
jgi:hypothetical protein